MSDYKKPSGAVFKLARHLQERTEDKVYPITESELFILAKKHPQIFEVARSIVVKRLEGKNGTNTRATSSTT